jgi:cell pole-organizing protein PopZ
MPDAKSRSEPSEEEIIASIFRVITPDRQPANPRTGGKTSPAQRDERDVVELTQVVEEDGSIRRIAQRTVAEAASSDEPLTGSDPRGAILTTHTEPQGHPVGEPTLGPVWERIVSTATSERLQPLAQLGSIPRDRGAERTLEDLVREMLRPMLQSWLDQHLPGIVERLVREEIARVVGESGLR